MDKEALKKSVTLNLRCVTQSSKGGVPLTSLQDDYKGLIGTAIPFIELGYKSLEAFLQSIPDVVCLKKTKSGQCTVEGVADASTAHIASLISRQKTIKGTAKKANSKKPSLPIRKYPYHDSWKSAPTNSGGISKQDGKDREKLKRSVQGVLNKLTPQAFQTLLTQLKGLNIDTEEKLNVVTNLIYEKAIHEPNFTVLCANLCTHLALIKVPLAAGGKVNLRKLLVTKCQIEFEQDGSDELKLVERMKAMEVAEPDKQKKMKLEFDLEEKKMRNRKLGNIGLIGELFKLGMLIEPIMHECIKKLLSQGNEESLECLCILLKSVGNELNHRPMDMYFAQMQKFVDRRLTSSRVRFMLQDVIDLEKTFALNSTNRKVPAPKPMNLGTISSAPRKVVSANQNNVISGQSNTKINSLGEGPSKSGELYSSLFTDTKTFIVPALPSSSSQKQTEVQKIATSHISEIPSTSKELVPVLNLAEDSTLSKTQRRRRRKKAKIENLVEASEPSLTKSQRKNLRKKIRKAKKLQETTEMFMEMLKENCAPPTLLNKNQLQDSGKTIEVSPTIQKQQLKELTLKTIKSVTLSCKGGVLLSNLQKDYKNIQDIPDVINLKKNKEGQIHAQAVSDASTAHISNLVSQQKQSNISKKTTSTSKKCSVLTKYASQNTLKTSRNSLSNAPIQELESSNQCPLETIQAPVTPKAITKSMLPSLFQGEPPYSALPKEAASNIMYKPTLNCFPSIRYSIASAKFSSILMMNLLLFGDDSYMETLKRGILAFDGFSFCEGSEQWKQKEILLSMLSEDTLRECLKLLCIECGSDNKKELVNKLLQFLASPGNALSRDALENLKQLQECVH